jgi:2-isopropylmalate synthase
MKLLGVKWGGDVSALREYTELGARATSTPLPFNYPVFGTDAFRTGTGVHAAAIIKALKKGDNELADQVYSGVPAGMFGLHQVIEVGHMGGRSNIEYWLNHRNIEPRESLVTAIFEAAKSGNRILDDSEVMAIVAEHGTVPADGANHGSASV